MDNSDLGADADRRKAYMADLARKLNQMLDKNFPSVKTVAKKIDQELTIPELLLVEMPKADSVVQLRFKINQTELRKWHDSELMAQETDAQHRHIKERDIMTGVMGILKTDITPREFLDMDLNKVPNLTIAELNKLKQYSDTLRPLRKLDVEEFIDAAEEQEDRAHLEDRILTEAGKLMGKELGIEEFLGINVMNVGTLSTRQKLRLLDLQEELGKVVDKDMESMKTHLSERETKENELLAEAKKILKRKVTAEQVLGLISDNLTDLTENQRGEIKVIQRELKILYGQDIDDMQKNPEARHEKEYQLLGNLMGILGGKTEMTEDQVLSLDVAGLEGLSPEQIKSVRFIQENIQKLHDQDLADLKDDSQKRHGLEADLMRKIHGALGDGITKDDHGTFNLTAEMLAGLKPEEKVKVEHLVHDLDLLKGQDQAEIESDPNQRVNLESELLAQVEDKLGIKMTVDEFIELEIESYPGITHATKRVLHTLQDEMIKLRERDEKLWAEDSIKRAEKEQELLEKINKILGVPNSKVQVLILAAGNYSGISKLERNRLMRYQDRLRKLVSMDWKEMEKDTTLLGRLVDTLNEIKDGIFERSLEEREFLEMDISKRPRLSGRQKAYASEIQEELQRLLDLEGAAYEEDGAARHLHEMDLGTMFNKFFDGEKVSKDLILNMDIDHQDGLDTDVKQKLHEIQNEMKELHNMSMDDLENDADLRHNREDEIENKMRGVLGGMLEPGTKIADLPGLSPNQRAELETLQGELKSLREMDWAELEEDPIQRHEREDDILGILLNTVGKKMSVNEFLNLDTKKSEWKPDQKKTALALQTELRELKELDAIPENMEEQFTCLIEDQKNLKVKNQLREIRDGFKFHEYE
jgi:hypothetical protein